MVCKTHIWPIVTFAGALMRGSEEVRRDDISRVIVRKRVCERAERLEGGAVVLQSLVDWAVSGFFPPWLESVGIQYSQPPASFERYRWFITGVYPEYENFWGYFMGEVHRGFMIRPPAP